MTDTWQMKFYAWQNRRAMAARVRAQHTSMSSDNFAVLWNSFDLIQCITLRERPERRKAAEEQFARVGLAGRVTFLEQDRDMVDGKRGCFTAHQQAAQLALQAGAQRALIFEDDVDFLPHFTPHAASRAAAFLDTAEIEWSIFFLGHFPKKMELTMRPEIVKVRSMDGHAYVLSPAGARELCGLSYSGDQVDVSFHYQCAAAYALYPMVAVQTPGPSDTEGYERAEDWNNDKLDRERDLYQGCVSRKALATALGQSTEALAMMGALSGPTARQKASGGCGAAAVLAAAMAGAAQPSQREAARPPPPVAAWEAATKPPPPAPPPPAPATQERARQQSTDPMVENTFEWVAGWHQLEPLLTPSALGLPPSAHAVDLGCGYSTLPLHLGSLYGTVTALDREAECVTRMTAKYKQSEHVANGRVRWAECDVCSADSLAAVLPRGSATVITDKGTLDCCIVEEDAARLLCNVAWLLAPGGAYVVVSFRKPELLLPVLGCPELGWGVAHVSLPMPGGEVATCCTCRRLPDVSAADLSVGTIKSGSLSREALSESEGSTREGERTSAPSSTLASSRRAGTHADLPTVESVGARLKLVVDEWYRNVDPLLTREREEQTRARWADAVASLRAAEAAAAAGGHARAGGQGGSGGFEVPPQPEHLPLRTAYEVLLTADERGEMDFDDFAADVAPFLAEAGRDAEAEPESAAAAPPPADPATCLLSLPAALAYLQEQQ